MDGLTGILWHTEDRYLQVLEGAPDAVQDAFGRILTDDRHVDVHVLSDEEMVMREFGDWTMAGLPGEVPRHAAHRLRSLICNKDAEITRHFFPSETDQKPVSR